MRRTLLVLVLVCCLFLLQIPAVSAVYTDLVCYMSITHTSNQAVAVDLYDTCWRVQARITMKVDGSNVTYFGPEHASTSIVNGGAGTYAGSAGRFKTSSTSSWTSWLPG
jgi:hypothetical protein